MKKIKIFLFPTAFVICFIVIGCVPTIPVGVPTPTTSTDSNVFYKFSNRLLLNSGQNSIYTNEIDLNLDSLNDVVFYLEATYGREGLTVAGTNNTFTLTPTSTTLTFPANSVISSSSYINTINLCDCNSNNVVPYSNTHLWYIGFKTVINGNTHYGWMQLKYVVNIQSAGGFMPIPNVQCYLIDYAYHKSPDTAIQAGYH